MEENIKTDTNEGELINAQPEEIKEMEKEVCCKPNSCMHKIHCVMNVLTFIGMIVLFILFFNQKKSDTTVASSKATNANYSIAFVNSDSIMSQYKQFGVYKTQLENAKMRMEEEMAAKAKKFQAEVEDYQKKVQSYAISSDQAQKTEAALMQKQQQLSDLKDNMSNKLMEMELTNQTILFDSILSALKSYNKDHNFDYILGYSKGSGILYANEKFDITAPIVEILNKNMEKEK